MINVLVLVYYVITLMHIFHKILLLEWNFQQDDSVTVNDNYLQ